MRWHHYAVVAFTFLFGAAAIAMLMTDFGRSSAEAAATAHEAVQR